MKTNYKALLNNVTTFLFDVDGVLTDGSVFLIGDDMVRRMHTRDGYAMQLAITKGYNIGIITGGNSPAVKDRLERLGVTDVYANVKDKREFFHTYLEKHNLINEEVLYMGDDLPDYHVLQMAGVKTCPHNAATEIKNLVDYVSDKKGGWGCVRDVIEQTLKVQGKWFDPKIDY